MPANSRPDQRLIIPYGVTRVTVENLPRVAQVAIDPAAHAPLRLGDGPYRRNVVSEEAFGSEDDRDAGTGAARLAVLRRLHLRDCDVFEKNLRRWVDLYFDFIAAQALGAADELQALTPGVAVDPLLWALAALRPLPRAHIMTGEDAFTAVDIAMWDGEQIIAIVFAGGEKARRAQGLDGRVRPVSVAPPGNDADATLISDQLGDAVAGFWRGLAVPPDPFGPSPFRFGRAAAPSF